jgi:uncharacterized protein
MPVKDVTKSVAFFKKLGFLFSEKRTTDQMACMLVGDKKFVVMFFPEASFRGFTGNTITDTDQSTEVLFSIDAESREEVDQWTKNVAEAGGTIYGKPAEIHGWMYGCGFADLDGHRWNVLYMDMGKDNG